MITRRIRIAISAGALLISTIGAATLYCYSSYWKPNLESGPNERMWKAILCRAHIYLEKVRGGVPELAWTELVRITLHRDWFVCTDGTSLEAQLQFSSNASEEDRKAGAHIFHERCCTGCHGADGSGGPVAPSLTQSEYAHGDSDLAVFKVLRDGIAGTAMPSAGLSLRELLQVAAHLKMLQAHSSVDDEPQAPRLVIQVSSERLRNAGTKTDEWLTYSGSYNGWRHTSLAEVTPANVAQLRIRWIKQFDIDDPQIEATPLVIDGVIFISADAGHVLALDAKTGDVIWEYKRPIPADLELECGHANRGLAVYGSTIFFGSLDGYLVAFNANDGKVIWQTMVTSPPGGYSITGAPLVINRSVVVATAGGDFRIRGFLAAYDVCTGRQQWQFNTIPGPGEVGHETWENDAWRTSGGGTWVTGSYDPSTDQLYWGVGNPAPAFSGDVRPGDNLVTASAIALHASTGKLAWYFQFTPHDEHDRDAAQTPVLADLMIKGEVRKIICWPNRNGFNYVLDRITGEFLLGTPFVEIDWAKGLSSTGRPILTDAAAVPTAGHHTRPGINGGTNWQNPSFDPGRGFIFVSATESSSVFTKLPQDRITVNRGELFTGSGWSQTAAATNEILALDAISGRQRRKYRSPSGNYGGLLATEGGLVFGPQEGSPSHWMRTPGARLGAFHLTEIPNPPRSHLRSTGDK
jgi:alcohol dehydrogenase (cytochrome c)